MSLIEKLTKWFEGLNFGVQLALIWLGIMLLIPVVIALFWSVIPLIIEGVLVAILGTIAALGTLLDSIPDDPEDED